MSQEFKKPVKALQFLNKKGQGIVEFALILAFCAGIGIAAREAGFSEALDAAFAGTGEVAAPKDIQPGVSTGSSGSSTTVTIDESSKLPEKTDQKYTSMTSDEVKDFNFLNDLKTYFESHSTGNNIDDDIWNAYKGNQTFDNDEAEARARRVGLALLDKGLTGDNAIEDAVWKDLKAEKNWAFDQDDKAIYDFLNSNSSMSADELRLRNVYLSELDSDTFATLRSNSNNSRFDNENIYSSYLAIKKKFWPNPVNLSLAPVISNPAFNATSDEMRIFNYVAGVSGQTGLVGYFESFSDRIPNPADRLSKDLSVFKLGNEFAADGDNDELTVAMFSAANNGITAVDDNFWKQIKQNKGWALDTDDETIKAKLTEFIATIRSKHENETLTDDEIITELKERNTQFNKLENSSIANMISNLESNNLNEDAYVGYLAIKKQYWQNTNQTIQQMALDPKQGSGGSGALSLNSETVYGMQTSVLNVTDENWSSASLEEKQNLMKDGTIFKYNGKYYVFRSDDKSGINSLNWIMQYGAVEVNNSIKDENDRVVRSDWGGAYVIYLNAGDIVVKDNEAFIYTNKYNNNACYGWNDIKDDRNNLFKIGVRNN